MDIVKIMKIEHELKLGKPFNRNDLELGRMGHEVSFWLYFLFPCKALSLGQSGNTAVTQAEIHNCTPGIKICRNFPEWINQIHILL